MINTNDVYTVAFFINERTYPYPLFCLNHQQALEKAFGGHEEAWGPLPIGSRCVGQGPCHDAGCPCQGMNLSPVLRASVSSTTNTQNVRPKGPRCTLGPRQRSAHLNSHRV